MPSINLVDRLQRDYTQFRFENASASRWSFVNKTVYYHDVTSASGQHELLHELGHALLGHDTYAHDVELVRMERDAWDKALEIASNYQIEIPDETIEEQLDTYRDWLHARSRCPNCHEAGVQQQNLDYHCLLCGVHWHANEAKHCGLRRYTKNPS